MITLIVLLQAPILDYIGPGLGCTAGRNILSGLPGLLSRQSQSVAAVEHHLPVTVSELGGIENEINAPSPSNLVWGNGFCANPYCDKNTSLLFAVK
jgi:hypothetical protein